MSGNPVIAIVNNKWFKNLGGSVIVLSCILLALNQPLVLFCFALIDFFLFIVLLLEIDCVSAILRRILLT